MRNRVMKDRKSGETGYNRGMGSVSKSQHKKSEKI
jgi:hypothetical protein